MGQRLRKQTVYGYTLPVKKAVTVQPSDFLIGGLIGLFERKFTQAFVCRNSDEARDIFGYHVNPLWYGWDALTGFFQNLAGVDGKIYIKSHVGYTGSAIDGVSATKNLLDGSAADTIQLNSGYKTFLDYSVSGNRTGYTITNGARFSTTAKGDGTKDDLFVVLNSIAGIIIGDIMKFTATGGGGATIYKKITEVDYSTGKVFFDAAFDGSANMKDGDTSIVMGFRIRTWRKSAAGVVTEVDSDLGQIYCTLAADVANFYFVNIFANSKFLAVTDLFSASALGLNFPVDVSSVTYLESGADGTTPTTESHWDVDFASFDNLPVRFLANSDTTLATVNIAGEAYCFARWDKPKWLYNGASNQSKSQLITIGNGYQRADEVDGVYQEKWYYVNDPFSSGAYAPYRAIPSVGHVMGAWINSIGTLGIHWQPSTKNTPIKGILGLVGTEFTDADDRTDLNEAGVNTTIFMVGVGYVLKAFYTPSTDSVYMWAVGILMKSYVMVSVVDSKVGEQDEPNSLKRIQVSADAILSFYYQLWSVGSTGNVPVGETFGQGKNADGSDTKPEQHFFVQADVINNPQASIDAGNRNEDSFFTFPAGAGSIRIGIGLLQRLA